MFLDIGWFCNLNFIDFDIDIVILYTILSISTAKLMLDKFIMHVCFQLENLKLNVFLHLTELYFGC